jgi:ribosomal protein L7Ae-like RNA K-turn-binding protein
MGGQTQERSQRALALLGLAHRAGRLALGISAVERMAGRRQGALIIVTSDAGEALRRRVARLASGSRAVVAPVTRRELAATLNRRDLAVVAVAETGFVRGLSALNFAGVEPRGGSAPDTG